VVPPCIFLICSLCHGIHPVVPYMRYSTCSSRYRLLRGFWCGKLLLWVGGVCYQFYLSCYMRPEGGHGSCTGIAFYKYTHFLSQTGFRHSKAPLSPFPKTAVRVVVC
jgi:hypothetical protein